MTRKGKEYEAALALAAEYARSWLAGVDDRPVGPRVTADDMVTAFGGPLPDHGTSPDETIDLLGRNAEPGLMAIQSGRFYGWVMGGTLPAALGADWLVSAWDQNGGMRASTPAVAALEEVAARWLLDLLGLPADADVGFTTGATMANFTGLAAARFAVLDRLGWDVHERGLNGAPPVYVLVGAERHDTVDLALRYLGLGRPTVVAADEQGRIRVDALGDALGEIPDGAALIVCLQAGNVHSGAFDPFTDAIALAHGCGAWVHVDGAFGLWAAASPKLSSLTAGMAAADSWASDAHKTLNVPYDCGVAMVADSRAMRAAMDVHASYLIAEHAGPGNPYGRVPELSRRARGVPVWAALRSLGRDGVVGLVEHLAHQAATIADAVTDIGGITVLNDVVYTQVCLHFGDDARTEAAGERLVANGEVWMSRSRWQGKAVVRVSVSNAATDDADVARTLDAVRSAAP
jgi:glutamate/tyrosine decarboxylase-like PLP-dependent enzyme